ncbi:uncharacterized protein LOC131436590 [Malaya genurostris]|uniref:uncharacterized protein LOC131436590 n=1 Tax=Malaya genurostris TaxID=325434 RepID=UPI0026F39029|nr:uncharacterized protein LOC131436590 [Malaya genurostris]
MNYYLALVGILCLVGGIRAATLNDTINGNVTLAITNLNTTINTVNATITAADKNTLKAWANWGYVLTLNLTAINKTLSNTSVDLSTLTSALSSLNSSYSPTLMGSDNTLIGSVFPTISQQIQQLGNQLIVAANNISSQVSCANDFAANCLKKYSANLTSVPFSRFSDCVTAGNNRIAQIGVNISSQINASLANSQTYLNMISLCNMPSPPAANGRYQTSAQCMSQFLGSISQFLQPSMALDTVRYTQLTMVYYQIQRCASLVLADLLDASDRVQASFYSCLSTGK